MGNIHTVNLPDIGEGVVEGEVIDWLKKEGDSLKQDEPVVIVMTDKATVELPAPKPGKLVKCYFKVGEKAILNKPLYDIEVVGSEHVVERKEEKKETPPQKQHKAAPIKSVERTEQKGLAIPSVRKLASEMGININEIAGNGKDGRITVEDLKHHFIPEVNIKPYEGDEIIQITGIPALMAKKMADSKRNIPHFSYFESVDATRLVQLRDHFKKEGDKEGMHVTYMPFLIRALSLTIKKFPKINSSVNMGKNELILHKRQNIGIAVSTKLGLIVPVLKSVENMNLEEIAHIYEKLKDKALEGKLSNDEMKEGTITISNFGVLGGGGMWATPIINYPESAILAVNKIHKQPVVRNDELVIRDILNLSWSFDHRIIDGDQAANVSHYFAGLLQNPASLT